MRVLVCLGKLGVMVLDVTCAFLYGNMRRRVHIGLPKQDPGSKNKEKMGRLVKAMYGANEAPQIWGDEVRREMTRLGFRARVLHPSVCSKPEAETYVVVHVDDFLYIGPGSELEELYASLKNICDLKSTMVRWGKRGEVLEPGNKAVAGWGKLGAGPEALGKPWSPSTE